MYIIYTWGQIFRFRFQDNHKNLRHSQASQTEVIFSKTSSNTEPNVNDDMNAKNLKILCINIMYLVKLKNIKFFLIYL